MRSPSLVTSLFALPAFLLAVSLSLSALAQDRTTEQGEAQITDPNFECTSYNYPPVSQAIAAGIFPAIWVTATILPNDANAMSKYQSIQSHIPNISPMGTQPGSLQGNWSGVNYDASSDPDCWWTWTKCTTPKFAGLPPDVAAVPEPDTLGYGFDDGPSCSHNVFYDYLQQNNQKATMFYIGSNVMNAPLEAQRGLADGHEICVHTWSHRYMTALTNEEVFAELYYTMEAIKYVVGVTPTCWRPPYGDVDDRVRAVAHALGLRTILWEYDSNDWHAGIGGITGADVDGKYEFLVQEAQSGGFSTEGAIMLTHELNNFTMSEAVKFYTQLKNGFKYLVPVGVALNQSQPYVESNYSLPSFEQYIAGTTTLLGGPPQTTTSVPSPTSSPTSSLTISPTSISATPTQSSGVRSSNGAERPSGMGSLLVTAGVVGALLRLMM